MMNLMMLIYAVVLALGVWADAVGDYTNYR